MYPFSIPEDSAQAGRCIAVLCMGKHPLDSHKNVKDFLEPLCAKHHHVLVLIADDPCKYYQMIPKRMTLEAAEKIVNDLGDQAIAVIDGAMKDWTPDNSTVSVVRWAGIKDENYNQVLDLVVRFRERFDSIFTQTSGEDIHRRVPEATLTQTRLDYFTQHTIDSLPLYLFGLVYDGNRYSHTYHPLFAPTEDASDLSAWCRSPITDVVEAYWNDPEFMEEARKIVMDCPRTQLYYAFFEKPQA